MPILFEMLREILELLGDFLRIFAFESIFALIPKILRMMLSSNKDIFWVG